MRLLIVDSQDESLLDYVSRYLLLKYGICKQILVGTFAFRTNDDLLTIFEPIEDVLGDTKAVCLIVDADIVSTDNNPL